MRCAPLVVRSSLGRLMEGTQRTSTALPRYFGGGAGGGRILSEEERAAENVYIQKMERERMEKLKLKAEKEKAKENANKKPDGEPQKS